MKNLALMFLAVAVAGGAAAKDGSKSGGSNSGHHSEGGKSYSSPAPTPSYSAPAPAAPSYSAPAPAPSRAPSTSPAPPPAPAPAASPAPSPAAASPAPSVATAPAVSSYRPAETRTGGGDLLSWLRSFLSPPAEPAVAVLPDLPIEPTGAGPVATPVPTVIETVRVERIEVPVPMLIQGPERLKVIQTADVFFGTGQHTLSADGMKAIRLIAMRALQTQEAEIAIAEGHADSTGDPAANQALSKRRADAVTAALVMNGVPLAWVKAEAFGDTKPAAPNTTESDRALNRRTSLVLRGAD